MKYNHHVMLDLETFGTRPGSIIRSIGAVVFDPYQQLVGDTPEFYCNVDSESQEAVGLTYDEQTVGWWKRQSQDAKDSLELNKLNIQNALGQFSSWFKKFNNPTIWCQGANFDVVLLEEVYRKLNLSVPWKYYSIRDTRTIYDIFGFDTNTVKREGTYHNALDDAKYQALCVQMAIQKGFSK